MYFRKVLLFVFVLVISLSFSLSAYAAPTNSSKEDKVETFFDTFGLSQKQIANDAADGDFGLYTVAKDGFSLTSESDLGLQDINDFKVFTLTKGFSKQTVVTFASSKILSGKGTEKTVVGTCVFTISKDGKLITSEDSLSIQTIGASGTYNGVLNYKLGDNYVIIAVMDKDVTIYRLYKVTVKQEETKGMLENIQIDFVPSTSNKSSVPSITSPISIRDFLPIFK